jgi:hypothetical protein
MTRATYTPESLGSEMQAPSGYYVPREEAFLDYQGRRLFYILGTMCVEASCCGVGRWDYVRVHGFVADSAPEPGEARGELQIDTIEDDGEKQALTKLILARHPGARVEFR